MNNETIKKDFMGWFKGRIDHYIELLNRDYEDYMIVNKTSKSVDFTVKFNKIPMTTGVLLSCDPICVSTTDGNTIFISLDYEGFANFIVDEYCS